MVALATTALFTVFPAHAEPGRLDRTVMPVRQSVTLTLDPAQADYKGTVRIELHAGAPADSFQMHARNLTVTSASMVGPSGAVAVSVRPAEDERITVVPASRMPAGDYTLDLEFTNAFDRHATGLYRLQYKGDWYAYTQFEAVDARQAFPCYDEPSFKIPWRVTLTVPTGNYAIANTDNNNMVERSGQRVFEFPETRPMPAYLVAFAVGPFDVVPVTGMAFPTGIVTPKGQSRLVEEAARMTPRLITALETYFKRPYPYEKLHLIAVPEFAYGAMENPGAITFAERILLLDSKTMSLAQRRRLAAVLAHEMSHMWFGDLVTMEWWDDLWLNESFASWMGNKITNQVYPELDIPVHELQSTDEAYALDDQPSARVIRVTRAVT